MNTFSNNNGNISPGQARLIIICLLAGLILGYGFRGLIGQGFADGYQSAREKLGMSSLPKEKNILNGSIKDVGDDWITMNAPMLNPLDPLELLVRKVNIGSAVITSKRLKTEEELLGAEVFAKIKELEKSMVMEPNKDKAKSLIEEIDNLRMKALDERSITASLLNQELSKLDKDSPKRQELEKKLQEIQENFVSRVLSLEELKSGQRIKITADKDILDKEKFSAISVEVLEY